MPRRPRRGSGNEYDRVEYKHNRQGDRIEQKDQAETVHQYTLDKLGRLTADKVTSFGTGVDQTVKRIDRSYEIRGLLEKITSYSDTAGNTTASRSIRPRPSITQTAQRGSSRCSQNSGHTFGKCGTKPRRARNTLLLGTATR